MGSRLEEIGIISPNPLEAGRAYGAKDKHRTLIRASRNSIPAWIRLKGRIEVCDRHEAKYVLADVKGERLPYKIGKTLLKTAGYTADAIAIAFGNVTAYYIHVDTPTRWLHPLVLRAISGAFSMVDNYVYGEESMTSWLAICFGSNSKNVRFGVKPPKTGEFERAVITGEHHTHLRPEEVWEVGIHEKGKTMLMMTALHNLRKMEGVTEALVATVLLYIVTAPMRTAYLVATSEMLKSRSASKMAVALKAVSTPIKSMQRQEVDDLSSLFELDVLVNRGIGEVDWEGEKESRVNPNVIEVEPEKVYKYSREVFSNGTRHGFKFPKMSMSQYIDSRWEWAPSGSVHSQYAEDKEYVFKDYRSRTKFVTLSAMSKSYVRKMFKSKPEICAWKSVKYEWAKQRAIYGTDLRGTVVTNFAMLNCERVLKHRFPVGEEAEAGKVHRRMKRMLKDSDSYCYDFDNFNAQHSIPAMTAVLMAYRDEFSEAMSDDQLEAMNWVIRSVENMYVMDGDTVDYKLAGTLLSGWRLTTFINTVLNYAYFRASGALGQKGVEDSVHNGDDVLVAIKSIGAAVRVDEALRKINARAQVKKCNALSIGEFLRVEHKITNKDGLGAQYLTRGCATYVHSRAESQEPQSVFALLGAIKSRHSELSRRSNMKEDNLQRLYEKLIENAARVFDESVEDCKTFLKTHAVAGGGSTGRWASVDVKIRDKLDRAEGNYAVDGAKPEDLAPGITDYAKLVYKKFSDLITLEDVQGAIYRGTRSVLEMSRNGRLEIVNAKEEVKYKFARTMYRKLHANARLGMVGKAKFLGINPVAMLKGGALGRVKNALRGASDVLWTLKVLT